MPLGGVTLKVRVGNNAVVATSDRDGRFTLAVPRRGRHELEASHGGIARVRRTVTVKRSGPTTVRLLLPVETLKVAW